MWRCVNGPTTLRPRRWTSCGCSWESRSLPIWAHEPNAHLSLVTTGTTSTLTSPGTDSMAVSFGSGFGTVNLTDTGGGHTLSVSGWTGNGSFKDTGSNPDTLNFAGGGSMTLAPTALKVAS